MNINRRYKVIPYFYFIYFHYSNIYFWTLILISILIRFYHFEGWSVNVIFLLLYGGNSVSNSGDGGPHQVDEEQEGSCRAEEEGQDREERHVTVRTGNTSLVPSPHQIQLILFVWDLGNVRFNTTTAMPPFCIAVSMATAITYKQVIFYNWSQN